MLRVLVVALLVANAAFLAWSHGWLDGLTGLRAGGDREPERLARQVRPESIRLLPAAEPGSGATTAGIALAPACLEAGPYTASQIATIEAAVRAGAPAVTQAGRWATVKTETPGTWIVYMGRFANAVALTRKEEELGRRRVAYEPVNAPDALAPGLSLGRFDERTAAERALERYAAQGIRTARVVELEPAVASYRLRAEQPDAALAAQLSSMSPEALAGKPFATCVTGG
jgi:hypothetical protein